MNRKRSFLLSEFRRIFLPALFVIFLNGCATINPWVQNFNIVPVAQEAQLGEKMETEIGQQMKLITGTAMNQRVESIGNELASKLPQKLFDYDFYVVDDPSLNAFAIPGGGIYVHTGLLKAASDAELAGVMAHEIGHVYQRHPAKSMSRAYGLQYLANLVLPQNSGQLQQMALQFAAGGLLNKYGRTDELEADEVAYYLMRKSRFPPQALISFFEKLQAASGGRSVPAFFSTHPPTAERIQHLQRLINQGNVSKNSYGL